MQDDGRTRQELLAEIARLRGRVRELEGGACEEHIDDRVRLLAAMESLEEAQRELGQSEARYRSLVENTLNGFFVFDMEVRKIIFTNQRCRDMFGFLPEETPSVWDLVAPEDCEMLKERLGARLRGEPVAPRQVIVTAIRRDGTRFRAEYSASMETLGDRKVLQGMFRDVTQEERLQTQLQQAEKMHALGLLAGGIAHDFSNLLHAILGYTQLLLMKEHERDSARLALEEIERLARQAGDLTRQILTFGRSAASQMRPLDMGREIGQMRDLLTRTLTSAIRVEFHLEPDLPLVHADAGQIEQVVLNLAVNARDAMPDGGTLRIETRRVSLEEADCDGHVDITPGDHVLLQVSDTGHGMEQAVREHIFEPFFTTKEMGRGTGLGLSVVYGIVKSHDGHIVCESEPGRGTTFRIFLPVGHGRAGRSEPAAGEAPAGGSETILIVDDEQYIRDVSARTLEGAGYRVITASSGAGALEILGNGRNGIDLVLLDMVMPAMPGDRVLEEMLARKADLRIVIACGQSVRWSRDDAMEAGARAIIRKPYDAAELLGIVRRTLDAD